MRLRRLASRAAAVAFLGPFLYSRRFLARLLYHNADLVARFAGFDAALHLLRNAGCQYNPNILRALGATVGSECMIHSPLMIQNTADSLEHLKIGQGVHVGRETFLDLTNEVEIESNVTISMRSTILTHMDVGRSPLVHGRYPKKTEPVRLQSGCYLGAGAIVLAGVTVGPRAAVAAGAVVTENVSGGATVGGVPAKPLHAAAKGTR